MKFELENFKQSNVARIFLAYAVVAFGMMQIFDYLLPIIEAPLWVAQTLTLLLFLGFPISLLVGWVTQRPIISSKTVAADADSGYAHTLSRQKLVLIGLGSSAIFGFLGFISMPYLLDQASFNQSISDGNDISQISNPNYRSFRGMLTLGLTGQRLLHNTRTDIAISDDGMTLAFLRHNGAGNGGEIFLKDLGVPDSERSLGALNAANGSGLLFFSEDGNWLHFISGGNLMRVRVEGGAFQTISQNFEVLRSGFTTYEDKVIFSNSADNKLYSIAGSGGQELPLPFVDSSDRDSVYSWPRRLPESNQILVTRSESPDSVGIGRIDLYNIDTGETRALIETASNAQFVKSGHIVFVRDNALWAVPFDLGEKKINGLEVPVIQGIETNSSFGHATYTVSDEGRLVYLAGSDGATVTSSTQISWISRKFDPSELIVQGRQFGHLTLSPSEQLMATTVYEPNGTSDIWVWDLVRKTLGRRTFEGKASRSIWSPDGRYLIYSFGTEGLRSVAADGTESPVTIMTTVGAAKPTSMSSNGDIIYDSGSPRKIYSIQTGQEQNTETNALELDLAPSYNNNPMAQISPDGNWIVYTSTESGLRHIYVRPYPEINQGKWQVSIEPGFGPLWSESGDEIFYISTNRAQYSVPYTVTQNPGDSRPRLIEFGIPEEMFSRNSLINPRTFSPWDYSAGKESFIFLEAEGGSTSVDSVSAMTNLVVVENWFEELKSLAPPGFAD